MTFKKLKFTKQSSHKKKVILLFAKWQRNLKNKLSSYLKFKRNFLSLENYWLKDSLSTTDIADITTSFYDSKINKIPILGDLNLLLLCHRNNIEYLVISDYNPIFDNGNPRFCTLKFISRNLKIKLISIWWDTVSDDFYETNKNLILLSYKNVYSDTSLIRSFYRSKKEDLNFGPAIDPKLINIRKFKEKDIDVIFLGSLNSYRSYRNKYLEEFKQLKKEGIKTFIGGGHESDRLTLEEYFALLGRSKICINFSASVPGKHQLKGRVYEALASKCLLLESKNSQTADCFDENIDFVSFKNPPDMSKKIKFYLKNDDLLVQIAESGNKKYKDEYNYSNIWKTILDISD